ncbi:hypothetical protein FHS18_004879 [Paenibacillus phyllosphaerae]|uniref:ChbG/HpnK family deacetylase n=1 Tax=Paenibacillus phyllosphaerae TaxID=274593 RepID=A0A7W5B1P1_9BACL|nr:ChbG/HpnK family deacetylase [Paenibacillus phyllosphaerae]MBB3112777.1 hypothetical protein [Paenibacillus phyllosphaerae]
MAADTIRIIARGDDAGSSVTANRAIQEAISCGFLRNVSLMACCGAIEDAADRFAPHAEVCFGLHATLNAEWDDVRWGPVLPPEHVPSLVDREGMFFQTVAALAVHGPQVEEVMAELQAQLNRLRALGFHISYADMHMDFSKAIPGFEAEFDDWCSREGLINAIPYYRNWITTVYAHLTPYAIERNDDPIGAVIHELDQLKPGEYLIVGHPAYDNAEMRNLGHAGYTGDRVSSGRHWERLLFTDPRILAFVQAKGIVPIRYDEAEDGSR